MIQCYFGSGKGKTTASVGAAVRYLGCKKNVLYVSFLKDGTSSELEILKNLPGVALLIPPVSYRLYDNCNPEKTEQLTRAYTQYFEKELCHIAPKYDMIVLDEILDVVSFGYLSEMLLTDFLKQWNKTAEIVLTGHCLSPKIAEICDYISEISSKRHPYEKGIKSRKGIEY